MNMQMLLEAAMLLCFGLAWPIATMRMLRTGRAEGKGLGFTFIIWTGYLAGAVSKLVTVDAPDVSIAPVFWLYLLNSVDCRHQRRSAVVSAASCRPVGAGGRIGGAGRRALTQHWSRAR